MRPSSPLSIEQIRGVLAGGRRIGVEYVPQVVHEFTVR